VYMRGYDLEVFLLRWRAGGGSGIRRWEDGNEGAGIRNAVLSADLDNSSSEVRRGSLALVLHYEGVGYYSG
jgi:hypothetical protein